MNLTVYPKQSSDFMTFTNCSSDNLALPNTFPGILYKLKYFARYCSKVNVLKQSKPRSTVLFVEDFNALLLIGTIPNSQAKG